MSKENNIRIFKPNDKESIKNIFIEVEKKKYPIELINKPLKQKDFKNN